MVSSLKLINPTCTKEKYRVQALCRVYGPLLKTSFKGEIQLSWDDIMLCPLRSEEHCFFSRSLPSAYPWPDEPACPWRCLRSTALNHLKPSRPTNVNWYRDESRNVWMCKCLFLMSCECLESMGEHYDIHLKINIYVSIEHWQLYIIYSCLLIFNWLHLRLYMLVWSFGYLALGKSPLFY